MDDATREVLLAETHREIQKAAENALAKLSGQDRLDLAYPPNGELSEEQAAALRQLELSGPAREGLQKLVADACASASEFSFWGLMSLGC